MHTFYRRRLPHLHITERPIFLTWRLHGSLPANRVFPPETTAGKAFVAMDAILDRATHGPIHLVRREIAILIVQALHHGQNHLHHYDLHAYVVMANHVHLLITPHAAIVKITRTLKRFTATEANRILNLTGHPFWQDESYDHLVRNQQEFDRISRYIEINPVRAGVAADPTAFPWSSASGRLEIGPRDNNPAPLTSPAYSHTNPRAAAD